MFRGDWQRLLFGEQTECRSGWSSSPKRYVITAGGVSASGWLNTRVFGLKSPMASKCLTLQHCTGAGSTAQGLALVLLKLNLRLKQKQSGPWHLPSHSLCDHHEPVPPSLPRELQLSRSPPGTECLLPVSDGWAVPHTLRANSYFVWLFLFF